MGIKPIIVFKDGGLVKEGTTRNVKKTIVELLNANKELFSTSEYDYTIMDFDANPALYAYVEGKVKEILGVEPVHAVLPINVCAHCGPGTIGIITSKKVSEKPLIEYVK
jgi:fatty acid-binding protein DegV